MDINEKLIKCLNHVGVIASVEDELDNFKDFLDDSITFISLIVELEQEFDIEIPDDYLLMERFKTYESLKNIVAQLIKAEVIRETNESTNKKFDNLYHQDILHIAEEVKT